MRASCRLRRPRDPGGRDPIRPQGPSGFRRTASRSCTESQATRPCPAIQAQLGRSLKATLDRMMALPKVTIAAMNGNALGGSFELTLACDLRIGQHGDFRYGNPEVRAGVIPGGGGTQRITRLVGLARALDWVLRGRIVSSGSRLRARPRPRGRRSMLLTRALELAEEIALLPPMAVANAKRALYQGADTHLQAAYEIENMNWTEVMQSDDAQLAMTTILAVDPESRSRLVRDPEHRDTTPPTPATDDAARDLPADRSARRDRHRQPSAEPLQRGAARPTWAPPRRAAERATFARCCCGPRAMTSPRGQTSRSSAGSTRPRPLSWRRQLSR